MTVRVELSPRVLEWAIRRSGANVGDLQEKFPQLDAWVRNEAAPTMRQVERLAKATKTAIGLLFLEEPPTDTLPIRDFRTFADEPVAVPSPDLLDTIEMCQRRQDWYRDYLQNLRAEPLPFVASVTVDTAAEDAAAAMRSVLRFEPSERGSSWSEALVRLIDQAEDAGVLVMVNGVVGSNVYRPLDPDEFRGFSLVDELAPVVFINGKDTKAAQIFTLAHELAHVWLGVGGVDDADLTSRPEDGVERWCNSVAAEFLVPAAGVAEAYDPEADITEELNRLASTFKVSTLVVLRRIADAGLMTWVEYRQAYGAELERVMALLASAGSGGNFYNTQPRRVSKRFARALLASTLAGGTTYGETFRLMATRNPSSLREMAVQLGVE